MRVLQLHSNALSRAPQPPYVHLGETGNPDRLRVELLEVVRYREPHVRHKQPLQVFIICRFALVLKRAHSARPFVRKHCTLRSLGLTSRILVRVETHIEAMCWPSLMKMPNAPRLSQSPVSLRLRLTSVGQKCSQNSLRTSCMAFRVCFGLLRVRFVSLSEGDLVVDGSQNGGLWKVAVSFKYSRYTACTNLRLWSTGLLQAWYVGRVGYTRRPARQRHQAVVTTPVRLSILRLFFADLNLLPLVWI